jgi:hypothetical protein
VQKALEAGECPRALGYPSLQDAINLVRDGNVRNVPYSVEDVRRFFDIYGAQIPALRGKTTKRHARPTTMEDPGAKMQLTKQVMVADVMHICGVKFLVSVSSPLEILLVKHLSSLLKDSFGAGVQAHINMLHSRGFEPACILVDPFKSLMALQGAFPGVEIDPCGAGDHLGKIDIRIRRIKELIRAVIADLPYSLPVDRVKDLVTYAASRINVRCTNALADEASPRVRFAGFRPDFKHEFGLDFGDYAEVFNPKAAEKSNDVTVPRTEPCIALYPSENQNGSWVFFNLSTKTYVRRTQGTKLPTSKLAIQVMNELAGTTGIRLADLDWGDEAGADKTPHEEGPAMHMPSHPHPENTQEEVQIELDEDLMMNLPELTHEVDNDSVSKSSETDSEMDVDEDDPEDEARFEEELHAEEEQQAMFETDSSGSSKPNDNIRSVPLRRTLRENAGVQRYDSNYEWNLMNLSVGAAIRNFGETSKNSGKDELLQPFKEKKALVPVKWENLTDDQKKKVVRSHMFLREKYEDGKFIKMKGRIVANGRMQDRTIYTDFLSPTAKTRSVMTCLKLAAVQGWDLLKVDVGGAFFCASIDDAEEVYMQLDEALSNMAQEWMPELTKFVRIDGKLIVKVKKAMYGLIQSAKLWYKELSRFLEANGFKKCPLDECAMVKKEEGEDAIVRILYVDNILILSGKASDCYWVKDILKKQYQKVTVSEGKQLPYLGMTIIKTDDGFKVCMESYIQDILKYYGKTVREYVTPTKPNLFKADDAAEPLVEKAKFHSVVAKLKYLGKRGRPDILLPVQFLCTRVKAPTANDERKLERVLGYLKLTKEWAKVFDKSPFECVRTYIDASFAIHPDGKSQSGCAVLLGNTLVHKTCRKQKIITKNSTEAELVALSDHILEGELIEGFVLDMGALCDIEVLDNVHLVYQDNKPTMTIVTKSGGQPRTKYMKVREKYVMERLGTK